MHPFLVLSASARACGTALLVSFVLLTVVAGLAGPGTARLRWLLPAYFLAVLATFTLATIGFHRAVGAWLPGPGWHGVATCLQAAVSLVAMAAVFFGSLVVLNR